MFARQIVPVKGTKSMLCVERFSTQRNTQLFDELAKIEEMEDQAPVTFPIARGGSVLMDRTWYHHVNPDIFMEDVLAFDKAEYKLFDVYFKVVEAQKEIIRKEQLRVIPFEFIFADAKSAFADWDYPELLMEIIKKLENEEIVNTVFKSSKMSDSTKHYVELVVSGEVRNLRPTEYNTNGLRFTLYVVTQIEKGIVAADAALAALVTKKPSRQSVKTKKDIVNSLDVESKGSVDWSKQEKIGQSENTRKRLSAEDSRKKSKPGKKA